MGIKIISSHQEEINKITDEENIKNKDWIAYQGEREEEALEFIRNLIH